MTRAAEIRTSFLGSPMDVPAEVAARLGIVAGQEVTPMQRAEIIDHAAAARFGPRARRETRARARRSGRGAGVVVGLYLACVLAMLGWLAGPQIVDLLGGLLP